MYMFFVREFNDIDHITPVVWKMNLDNFPVAVYCLNPEYDIRGDYRLEFLRKSGVNVNYIFDEFAQGLGPVHRLLRLLSRTCFAVVNRADNKSHVLTPLFSISRNRLRKIGKKIYRYSRRKFYDVSWARSIIEQTGTKVMCFDHVKPKRFVVKVLLKAAREKKVPTIALPHGVFIYTNNFVRIGSTEDSRYDKFNRFDAIVTQNNLRKEVLARAGVDRDKIFVLGSTRYCKEWMRQNKSILPRTAKLPTEDRQGLKVVFMTTRFAYRIDVDRMLKTFDILAGIEGIDVVVKPHTRTGKEAIVYEEMPLANVAEISSVELCEWADVMLVIGSSILIESLVQHKPVLYLKYLHENITQYEELGACWIIHDEVELQNALASLQKDRAALPYTEENVARFLSEIIYGGAEERDVLGDYQAFIVNMAADRSFSTTAHSDVL
ncbi:MAG: hypothetical protein JRJ12_08670 [Deltaproteobacteria bacterium]|nr:hypothetical protein [Deltaproteobacteria bacterium]MBW2069619.1 hypothetical protein [Deltaproteobacteria bacterium]